MTSEGEILAKWLEKQELSGNEFALKIGVTRQNVHYHLNQSVISDSFKEKIARAGFTIEKLNVKSIDKNKPKLGTPVFELSATGGQMENISQLPEVPSFHVNVPGYEDCNFGMYVYGHSMYPTIENGSLILCRKVIDKDVIMYGEIYLIRTRDYLMVKRLQKNEKRTAVLCTSDNFEQRSEKFRRFEPFELEREKVLDLYLVKGIIKKTQS